MANDSSYRYLPMQKRAERSNGARGLWLALLVLGIAPVSPAQFLTFTEYPVPTNNSIPGCIAQGPDGALWFTETGAFANKIGRVTTAGTLTEYPIPTFNSGSVCIAAGPDGALWFTEQYGNKIGRITTAGVITEYTIPTAGASPWGITAGADGALWFTENWTNKIGRITTTGTITEYLIPTAGSYPAGIAAGPDGALWFTESGTNKIGRITTAGVFTETGIPTASSSPWGIVAGPDNALWFTEQYGNKIGRLPTAVGAAVTDYPIPTQFSTPRQISLGSDGALWFTEQYGNKIGRITTAGAITEYAVPVSPGNPNGIALGPDDALWFTVDGPNSIFRAEIVTQAPPVSIFTGSPLPDGSVGVSYAQTLSATGGVPPYTWTVTSGTLPAALTLDPALGQIAGTPTASGTATFTVQVTDSSQTTATKVFSLTIDANNISQFPLPLTYNFGGITTGPDGALWFTETTSGDNPYQVGRITTSGEITEYPVTCDCYALGSITSGPDGALWFAAGTSIGRITTDGAVTEYFIPNTLDLAGITTGPDGALWFTDYSVDSIGRITTGGVITQYPVPPHGESNGIGSITSGPDGALWFGEAAGYIGRITTAGAVTEFRVTANVTAITSGPDGALWFAASNGGIGRITTAGVVTEYPTPAGSYLSGITTGPDKALWFTESDANKIGQSTTSAVITEYPIPTADAGSPVSITTGPDGALWFTQNGGGEGARRTRPATRPHGKSAPRGSFGNGGAIGRLLPPPTLTAINPASGAQGATVPVVLTGSSFVTDATTVNVPNGITLTNLSVVSTTQVAVTFSIAASVATGPVNITVTTDGGTSSPVSFTITPPPPPPALTSINPPSGVQGTSVPVALTGANFIAGPTVIATNFYNDYNQLVPLIPTPTPVDNGQLTVTATVYPDPTDANSQWVDFNFQSVNGGPLASNLSGFWQVYLTGIPLTTAGTFTGVQSYWTINGTAAPNITAIPGLNPVVQNLINPSLGLAYAATFPGGAPLTQMDVFVNLSNYASSLRTGNMDAGVINGFHLAARTTGGLFGPATVAVSNPGVAVSNVTLVSATQITALLNIAAGAALGAANVTVTTPIGTSAPATFTVLPPTPTLTSVSPAAGTAGTSFPVSLSGSNFVPGGTTVNVSGGVTTSDVVVTNSAQLTVTLTIPVSAAPGTVDVTVNTSGGSAGPLPFTIDPPPQITTASPLPAGTVGSAYSQGVSVTGGTPPYTWTVSAGSLPAGLSLDAATCTGDPPARFRNFRPRQTSATTCLITGTPGAYGTSNFTLQVTDASGASTRGTFALTINPLPPTITSISPSAGAQGTSVPVTIAGTNFVPGATVFVNNPGVAISDVQVASPSQITASFTISAEAALGPGNVLVTTSGGTTLPAVFTVLSPEPVVTAISPASGAQGTSVQVTLTGNNFVAGATIAVSTAGVTASSITVVSPTQITATLTIAGTAAAGPASVTVTTPTGTSAPVTFTITSLLLSSISPASALPGASVPVTLTGAGFVSGAQVIASSPDVTLSNVVVVSAAQITATLKISANAPLGPVNITVVAGGVTSAPVTFTIGNPPVIVSSINPAAGSQGTSVPVTLTGNGFVAGARVLVSNTGVTVGSIVVVSATQITATFTIAADAAAGPVNVTVSTSAGTSAPAIFTILPPLTLTSISPTGGLAGTAVPVTLTGAGFAQGAQVSVGNADVAVVNINVVSATQITATFDIAAAAAPGPAHVTVTVGGVTSAPLTFTVSAPPPTLTSISSSNAPQGGSVAITLNGTNFIAGATITPGTPGITASNLTVVNATQITATLTIAADAAVGATTVAVTTAGGTSGTVSFTVNPAVTFSITGLPDNITSGQQLTFAVSIAEAYPEDLSGELTLTFTPSGALPTDPMITLLGGTCTAGTCTADFQIPAAETSATLTLQTGTVAGTLEFSIDNVAVGGTAVTLPNNPTANVSVPPQTPGITSITIEQQSSGFNIVVTGFSNTRDITEADFTFTPTSGSQLQTSTFALTNVAAAFQDYYASDASLAVGSEFVYTQPFNVTAGSISTLQSVTVTLRNAQGASSTVTANF